MCPVVQVLAVQVLYDLCVVRSLYDLCVVQALCVLWFSCCILYPVSLAGVGVGGAGVGVGGAGVVVGAGGRLNGGGMGAVQSVIPDTENNASATGKVCRPVECRVSQHSIFK